MYSFIAECKMKQNDFAAALQMYEKSSEMAAGLNDKLFAARGYLIAGAGNAKAERMAEMGRLLLENFAVASGIWSEFFTDIYRAISEAELDKEADWYLELTSKSINN